VSAVVRRVSRPGAVRVSRDRWLIAYADMITLLLACFAALYASSRNRLPGPTLLAAGLAAPAPVRTPAPPDAPPPDAGIAALQGTLEELFAARPTLAVDVSTDARGLVISLSENGAFATASADPSAPARQMLMDLATVLVDMPNAIRVEGHTDDVPIQSAEFPSNWELSTARATRVVQFLVERGGLPPSRLSAAGYGPYHPRVANDSDDARARNRRVDIVVLGQVAAALEPPRPETDR
jgi:chemotaxis protein MotB